MLFFGKLVVIFDGLTSKFLVKLFKMNMPLLLAFTRLFHLKFKIILKGSILVVKKRVKREIEREIFCCLN